ncbi:MAG TPA: hypothetical protein VLG46_11510 [Anaerolineae bacterium]|nr:hypothetical protein [Anaerolineae bacterium]
MTALVIALLLSLFGLAHGWQTRIAYAGGSGDDNAPLPTRSANQPATPAAPSATPPTTVYFDPQDNITNGSDGDHTRSLSAARWRLACALMIIR